MKWPIAWPCSAARATADVHFRASRILAVWRKVRFGLSALHLPLTGDPTNASFSPCLAIASLLAAPAAAKDKTPKIAPPEPRAAPASATDPENLVYLDLSSGGRVTVWLRPDVAPKMVTQFKTLVRQHFYDGLMFHRVIDGFMAQGGDPKGDGTGGSTLPNVPAEFNYLPHVRGALAAARAQDENSANSQFYIIFQPRLSLDKKYTVFGRVLNGMPYVDAIHRGEPPADPTRILHAYVAADNPPAYVAPPPEAAPLPSVTLPGSKPGPGIGTVSPTPIEPKLAPGSKPRR